MATIEIKDKKGKKVGTHDLSPKIAADHASAVTIHRAVVKEESAGRQGTQSARTRSEAKGGGRKPYKQKKTGNARQGTRRAPHFAHGGMALAVKPRDYDKKINKRERRAAILSALGARFDAGDVTVVDDLSFDKPKTKEASALLHTLEIGNSRRTLIILPAYDENTLKSFRNITGVEIRTAPSKFKGDKTEGFSARDVLVAHKLLIAKGALAKIEEVWGA